MPTPTQIRAFEIYTATASIVRTAAAMGIKQSTVQNHLSQGCRDAGIARCDIPNFLAKRKGEPLMPRNPQISLMPPTEYEDQAWKIEPVEIKVMEGIVYGHTPEQIAHTLGLHPKTVGRYCTLIRVKTMINCTPRGRGGKPNIPEIHAYLEQHGAPPEEAYPKFNPADIPKDQRMLSAAEQFSPYEGVRWLKTSLRWKVSIKIGRGRCQIGYFRDLEKAEAAYRAAEKDVALYKKLISEQPKIPAPVTMDDPAFN